MKRRAEEAEGRAANRPRTIPTSTHQEALQVYEEVHAELEDIGKPYQGYIETQIAELGDNKLKAEKLKEVVTEAEAEDEP